MVAQAVVRGQYSPGKLGDKPVPGLSRRAQRESRFQTETFVAGKTFDRQLALAGVPFYVRTGKRLAKRSTEIMIQFRRAPHIVLSRKRD